MRRRRRRPPKAATSPPVTLGPKPKVRDAVKTAIRAMLDAKTLNTTTCPQKWPGSRFDVVWIFDRQTASGGWSFAQVPQKLLSGDSAKPISLT
jgi:hypothetical protein